nr:hypothetical protein [uncultured archaeon]
MYEIDPITSAYRMIKRVKEQAEKKGINFSYDYAEDSIGRRLQEELNHIAADINRSFGGISDQASYNQFDTCLEYIETTFNRGNYFEKMRRRRGYIKERYMRARRLKNILDSLGNHFLR